MNCDIPNTLEANPSPIQHTTCWKVETSQHTHIENGHHSEVRLGTSRSTCEKKNICVVLHSGILTRENEKQRF